MQTLHLRFRALRAISPGQSPSRWQTPSMRDASKWKGAPPLPNHPKPTLAVGSPPGMSRQPFARCPTAGAGLPLASPFREASVCGAVAPDGSRICPRQTAHDPMSHPAPQKAGEGMPDHGQARASEVRCTPSFGLSFPLRPRRCGARASGEKTADRTANDGASAGVSHAALRRRSSSAGRAD
jgi:hypothetical protein